MTSTLAQQAERFYQVFSELMRAYQFRDREGTSCNGLSVSACYTLDTLAEIGSLPMKELARQLQLEVSSVTRVVDGLVVKRLAVRTSDPHDRRICRVAISEEGRAPLSRIRDELIQGHLAVLRAVPAQRREAVIKTVSLLHSALSGRHGCRSAGPTESQSSPHPN